MRHSRPLIFSLMVLATLTQASGDEPVKEIRVGLIGLDTSHSVAFTTILNDSAAQEDVAHCRVVAAYPRGSADIASSVERIPEYTEQVKALRVEIVDSVQAVVDQCDAVLLETNDGRPHLEQVLPALRAHKPVFIDKPIAASLGDAVAIFMAAEKYQTPVFSSSSLRYVTSAQQVRSGSIGKVYGCDAMSNCPLEPTHPDLYWYGIHGVETLFTVMGTGCQTVSRTHSDDLDVVVGLWQDGRIGTFRGIRKGKADYGGVAFGENEILKLGSYEGYRPLVVEIVKFFRTNQSPIDAAETLEIYAFMSAADESKRQGGAAVSIKDTLDQAKKDAQARLAELDP